MTEEFILSEKARKITNKLDVYKGQDVKEFVKLIKKEASIDLETDTLTIQYSKFKKFAGKKLK